MRTNAIRCIFYTVGTASFLFANNAMPAEFLLLPGTKTLYMMGEVTPSDLSTLRRFLRDHEIDTLGLAGPGGSLRTSLMIGEVVKAGEIITFSIPDRDCASACALIFMSGGHRIMGERSRIGVHLPFIDFEKVNISTTEFCRELRRQPADGTRTPPNPSQFFQGIETTFKSQEICLTATYQKAFEDAFNLFNIIDDAGIDQQVFVDMISTHPSSMTWYTPEDGSRLNLATTGVNHSAEGPSGFLKSAPRTRRDEPFKFAP